MYNRKYESYKNIFKKTTFILGRIEVPTFFCRHTLTTRAFKDQLTLKDKGSL